MSVCRAIALIFTAIKRIYRDENIGAGKQERHSLFNVVRGTHDLIAQISREMIYIFLEVLWK